MIAPGLLNETVDQGKLGPALNRFHLRPRYGHQDAVEMARNEFGPYRLHVLETGCCVVSQFSRQRQERLPIHDYAWRSPVSAGAGRPTLTERNPSSRNPGSRPTPNMRTRSKTELTSSFFPHLNRLFQTHVSGRRAQHAQHNDEAAGFHHEGLLARVSVSQLDSFQPHPDATECAEIRAAP